MVAAGAAWRVVVSTLLLLVLAGSGAGWADESPEVRAVGNALTLTHPPGLTVDAAPSGRPDALSGGAEQRSPKARLRLGLAVLVGLSLVLAAAIVMLTRPSPAPRTAVGPRWSATLRAPPVLRF